MNVLAHFSFARCISLSSHTYPCPRPRLRPRSLPGFLPRLLLVGALSAQASLQAYTDYLNAHRPDPQAVLYHHDFDVPGPLPPGWEVNQGQARLVTDESRGCLRVEPAPAGAFSQVTFSLDPAPETSVLFIDLMIKPVAFDEGPEEFADLTGSITGAFRLIKDPEAPVALASLHVLQSDPQTPGRVQWLDTGVRFALDEEGRPRRWMRLTFRQEFAPDDDAAGVARWDLWVDGRLVGVDLGYVEAPAMRPGTLTLLGHRRLPLELDSLTIRRDNPLFADADGDGLADAYERLYRLEGGRDADPDEDGLVNAQEYLLRSNPTVADTDGDGLSDGEEYAVAGRDPLDAGDASPSAAQAFQTSLSDVDLRMTMAACSTASVTFHINTYAGAGWEFRYLYDVRGWDQDGYPLTIYAPQGWTQSSAIYVSSSRGFLRSGSFTGTVYYRTKNATGSEGQIHWITNTVTFDCCQGCIGGACAGVSSGGLGSVKFRYDLGSVDFGERPMEIHLDAPAFTEAIYDRASLIYFGPREADRVGFETGPEGEERLLWARSDRHYTTWNDLPDRPGYEMRFYALDTLSPEGRPQGEPFRRVYIFDPDVQGYDGARRLRVVEEGDRHLAREYRFYEREDRQVWELYEGAPDTVLSRPLRFHRLTVSPEPVLGTRKEGMVKRKRWETGHWDAQQGALVIDSVRDTRHRRFTYGWRLIEEILDPDGQALSTRYGYEEVPEPEQVTIDLDDESEGVPRLSPALAGQTRRQWMERPDGYWEWYGYDEQSRPCRVVRPLGNQPRPASMPSEGPGYAVEHRDYDGTAYRVRIRETEDGVVVRTTFKDWEEDRAGRDREHRETVAFEDAALPDGTAHATTVTVHEGGSNRVRRVQESDGSERTYVRTWAAEGETREETVIQRGPITAGAGGDDRVERGRTTTITHRSGMVMETLKREGPSQILTGHRRVSAWDERYRPTLELDPMTGEAASREYACCGLSRESAGEGETRVYERDALGRVIAEREGYGDPLAPGDGLSAELRRREFRLDGLDRRRQTTLRGEEGVLPLVSEVHYNLAGQETGRREMGQPARQSKILMLPGGGRRELSSLPRSGHDDRHRITAREYDAAGLLIRWRTYASSDPFASEPDPGTLHGDRRWERGWDEHGRYEEVIDQANLFDRRRTRTYFDAQGQKRRVIHAYGTEDEAVEHYLHDAQGRLILHRDADGVTTRYAYEEDASGRQRMLTAIDLDRQPGEAAGHIDEAVDRITRQSRELVQTGESAPMERLTTEVFTENGPRVVSIIENTGHYQSRWEQGRRTLRERIAGLRPGEWTIRVTPSDGPVIDERYAKGRLVQRIRRGAEETALSWTKYGYDGHGRMTDLTDSRLGTTRYHYDENGRRWKITGPGTGTQGADQREGAGETVYTYDSLGQVIGIRYPDGATVEPEYEARGTLRAVRGQGIIDREYRYNGRGERTAMITFQGPEEEAVRTRWYYDGRGRLASKEDASGRRVRHSYTPQGRPSAREWARGVRTEYHYHAANGLDLERIAYSDETPEVSFVYTRTGEKKTVHDGTGRTDYHYDPRGWLRAEHHHHATTTGGAEDGRFARWLHYRREEGGRLAGIDLGTETAPTMDYQVRYAYDEAGRLEKVASGGYAFAYGYVPQSTSDLVESVSASGIKETRLSYAPYRDTLLEVTNGNGREESTMFSRYRYQYDMAGKRRQRTLWQGAEAEDNIAGAASTEHYHYDDDTGGLIRVSPDGGDDGSPTESQAFQYLYDKSGNRRYARLNGRQEVYYQANELHQYTVLAEGRDQRQWPSYDADGNLTRRGVETFHWDGENRLREVRRHGELLVRYGYDHRGRRVVRETADGTSQRYVYDDWNLLAVYRGDGRLTETYTWGRDLSGSLQGAGGIGGLLLGRQHGPDDVVENWIYHYDGHGNVSEISDGEGRLRERYRYDPFGGLRTAENLPANRFRFSTKYHDPATGLYNYGLRSYDPRWGRWISRDPIHEQGGLNLYGFVENDPVNRWDYLGMVGRFARMNGCRKLPSSARTCLKGIRRITRADVGKVIDLLNGLDRIKAEVQKYENEFQDDCEESWMERNPKGNMAMMASATLTVCMEYRAWKAILSDYETELKALSRVACVASCGKFVKNFTNCFSRVPF